MADRLDKQSRLISEMNRINSAANITTIAAFFNPNDM